jgi:hypothetical protein
MNKMDKMDPKSLNAINCPIFINAGSKRNWTVGMQLKYYLE